MSFIPTALTGLQRQAQNGLLTEFGFTLTGTSAYQVCHKISKGGSLRQRFRNLGGISAAPWGSWHARGDCEQRDCPRVEIGPVHGRFSGSPLRKSRPPNRSATSRPWSSCWCFLTICTVDLVGEWQFDFRKKNVELTFPTLNHEIIVKNELWPIILM